MAIEGDSAEYEYLTEAAQISANVPGMYCEVGVRRGMGTKMFIDVASENRKVVISIDPYGSIEYIGREPVGKVRLDYTNTMRNGAIADLATYSEQKGVNWLPFIMTDSHFFKCFSDGVEINDVDTRIENRYASVHLDGEHTISAIKREIDWFNGRMDSGATIVIDDVTIDFVDIEPIKQHFTELGWELIKMGGKKGLWRKM